MVMKAQYDFSRGVRGKFYREDATLRKPIYLDPDVYDAVGRRATTLKLDVSDVVNALLKSSGGSFDELVELQENAKK